MDNAARAQRAGLQGGAGAGSGARTIPPVKIIAGNKCDLSESRQVSAAMGLEWARKRGCGFMETSARLEVNIVTKPLTPLGSEQGTPVLGEKRGVGTRGPRFDGREKLGKGGGEGFWRKLRCW